MLTGFTRLNHSVLAAWLPAFGPAGDRERFILGLLCLLAAGFSIRLFQAGLPAGQRYGSRFITVFLVGVAMWVLAPALPVGPLSLAFRMAAWAIVVGTMIVATTIVATTSWGQETGDGANHGTIPPLGNDEEMMRLRLLAHSLAASCDGVMVAEVARDPGQPLRIVYSNSAFDRLLGYGESEALGLSPSVLADDAEPNALQAVRHALRGHDIVRLEVPSRRKDGSRIWTEWQIVPVADASGRFTHTVAIIRDTTQRRQIEQALRVSESRFRRLFEQAADAIVIYDEQGRLLDANRWACRLFGWSRDELCRRKWRELERECRPAGSSEGEASVREGVYRRSDGSEFPAEVRYAPIEWEGRRLHLAFIRDISHRRHIEDALRQREELLRKILETIPCGVFWKDRQLRYLGCNRQVAQDWGFERPDDLIGKDDYQICPVRGEAEFYRRCDQQVIETGKALLHVEETMTRADGEQRVLLTSKVPLQDTAGQIIGVVGIYQDITEKKKLEQQLLQSQKMEAIGRLAGGIAHDFNNLLTVIRGNADLLRRAVQEVLPGELEHIDDLRYAAERAASLVRQLLLFSRPSSGQTAVLDLNEVISGMSGMLRRLLGERIRLITDLTSASTTIAADITHIEQVILNLSVNACDAMPQGGTLTIATRVVASEQDGATSSWVELLVCDTGIGMTDEVKAHIFEPFFTTKGPDKGSGLGLSTVFGIVQQLRGQIEVSSTPGVGTTFTIRLPQVTEERPTPKMPPVPAEPEAKPSRVSHAILLVEDEEAVRKLAQLSLEAQGYRVVAAADGESALELASRLDRIDILVTDLTMPGMSGTDLAQQLLLRYPTLSIVFMSGYSADDTHLRDYPGAIFVPKPFTPAELVRAVTAAGRKRPESVVAAAAGSADGPEADIDDPTPLPPGMRMQDCRG